jgi:hypothetical protein
VGSNALRICEPCGQGKHQPAPGTTTCKDCDKGKFAAQTGQFECASCEPGTYQDETGKSVCTNCGPGKYQKRQTATTCTDCIKNEYSAGAASKCTECDSGKYSHAGQSICLSCEEGKYLNPNFTKSDSQPACLQCIPCVVGTGQLARCWPNTTSPGVCIICKAGTRLVEKTGVCEVCPADEYSVYNATRADQNKCTRCPFLSTAPVAGTPDWSGDNRVQGPIFVPLSTSIQACKCKEDFDKHYLDAKKTIFMCGCKHGRYLNDSQCLKCGKCNHGEYRRGCELDRAGECVRCNFEQCVSDQQLAGCGGLHPGKCKMKTDLVRTPLCPVTEDFSSLKSRSAGFGSYDFTSIFRADSDVLDFRCSEICDGTKTFNTVECDGPYACNMATCAEDLTPPPPAVLLQP